MSSRWADEEADKALKQREKAEKARKKLLKQQKVEQEAAARRKAEEEQDKRPTKRQRTEPTEDDTNDDGPTPLFRFPTTTWGPCRNVNEYETLNAIEEGSYGWVSRARNRTTNTIVALKHLKLDSLHEGFPTTALREIQALKSTKHNHIVSLHEVVIGSSSDPSSPAVYLVMDFIEHDLKTLQENMSEPFATSEVKTLILQLTSAVDYLHTNWILHRDLKTSNILLTNRGEIKVADFGMARRFGDPMPPNMTQLVVTLWYRAPELLLGAETYDKGIDIWSLGCIMGELLQNTPLLPGKTEIDQLAKTFALCGLPTDKSWKHFRSLPNARNLKLPPTTKKDSSSFSSSSSSKIKATFPDLSSSGARLLEDLLALNPNRRPDAGEVLSHPWFGEDPRPKSAAMFPTFPSKAGQERRRRQPTPQAPRGGEAPKLEAVDFSGVFG